MNQDDPAETVSPPLDDLLRGAAMQMGMAACDAAKVAQLGALNVGGLLLVAVDLPSGPGMVGHDVVLSGHLEGARITQPGQAQLLLRANMVFGPTAGLSFGATEDGSLHLLHAARRCDMTPQILAERMQQLATIALAVRGQLSAMAPAGRPASAPAARSRAAR